MKSILNISEAARTLVSTYMGIEYPETVDFNTVMSLIDRIESECSVDEVRLEMHQIVIDAWRSDDQRHYEITYYTHEGRFFHGEVESKIEALWVACTKFINWYNTPINQPQ